MFRLMGCVNTKKGAVFSPTFFCVTHSLRGGGNLWQETQRQRQLAPLTASSTRYRRLRSRDGRCRFRYSTLLRLSLHQCKAVAHTAHTVPPTVASVPHSQPRGTHIHSYTLIYTLVYTRTVYLKYTGDFVYTHIIHIINHVPLVRPPPRVYLNLEPNPIKLTA